MSAWLFHINVTRVCRRTEVPPQPARSEMKFVTTSLPALCRKFRHLGGGPIVASALLSLLAMMVPFSAPSAAPVARHRRCAVFSGMDAGQNDRRPAGVARWRHPGIEAEIRRHDHTVPIESRRDPMPAFAASGNKGCDRRDQHQSAQRIGIAAGEAWCRRAGAQGIGILQ